MKRSGFSLESRLRSVSRIQASRGAADRGISPSYRLGRKAGGILSRSGFKKRSHVDSSQNHALSQKGKAGLKAGRRMKEWSRVWAWLKPRLEAAHRTECEFDFIPHNCYGPLDPAHSKKRSKMQGNDIYAVAIACRNIHRVLDEVYTHTAMEKAVMTAIERSGGLILPEKREAA